MTKPTLDELIVPAPPYRMARPVAVFTAAGDDFKNDALKQQLESLGVKAGEPAPEKPKQEATPPAPEKSEAERARERADAAEQIRDTALEATDSTLKTRGEKITEVAQAVRGLVATEAPAASNAGPAAVERTPVAPTGKYELPSGAKAEMDRIIAKQAELRAQGKEEEAKQWDVALRKYREFKKEDKAKFYTEKKKAEAAQPVADEKPAEAPAAEAPKKLEGLEAERASVAAATEMPEAKRAALLKEYDDAIAKRSAASESAPAAAEAAPEPVAEVGSDTTPVKPEESPEPAPAATSEAAPVPESEVKPAETPTALTSLEDELASLERAKASGAVNEARYQQDKAAYEAAIAKRDASPAEKPKVKPTAEELENFQKELREKAAAAERAEQESRGADMAKEAEEADKAQKKAVVEAYEAERAKKQAAAEAMDRAQDAAIAEEAARTQTKRAAEERAEQESRGAAMAAETDKRLQQEAARKIPTPAEVQKLRDAKEKITAKPEKGSWLRTLLDRNHAWQARAMALDIARGEAAVRNKFEFAQGKMSEYERKLEKAGPIGRLWYASRLKSWQARSMKFEGQVAKLNAQWRGYAERQAAYVRSIVERYDKELAPFQERAKDLSERLAVQSSVKEKLAERRKDALLQLANAQVAARRGRWFKEPAAAKAITEIKEQLREIERRINDADAKAVRYRSILTDAEVKIRVLEGKKTAVTERLKYPELKNLNLPNHETLSVNAPAESAPASPEPDPSEAVWKTEDFIKQWNELGLQPIDDPASLIENVNDEVRRLNLRGAPKAKDLKDIVLKYLDVTTRQTKKILESDWKRFLEKAKPKP